VLHDAIEVEEKASALLGSEVADGATKEHEHAATVFRDDPQVEAEVTDDGMDFEISVVLGDLRRGVSERLVADVEGDIGAKGPGLAEGV
jgi:hypothetical protein